VNCFLLINKPKGLTSFDVIFKLRKILNEKSIGHAGTLDKIATGLLLVAVGKQALKLLEFLIGLDKVYEAEMILGMESDTYDITGKIKNEKLKLENVTMENLLHILQSFEGKIEQIPPKFSALKINGKRASDRVRAGEEIQMKSRIVKIFKIESIEYGIWNMESFIKKFPNLLNFDIPHPICSIPYSLFTVHCSSGTYIRSLIHDIGQKLGCGAVMSNLRRTKIGIFTINQAVTLEKLEEIVRNTTLQPSVSGEQVISIDEMVQKIFLKIDLNKVEFDRIKVGKEILDRFTLNATLIAGFFESKLVSILKKDHNSLKVYKNFV